MRAKNNLAPSKGKSPANNKFEAFINSPWRVALLLFVVALLPYANSFQVPFQFDDDIQLVGKKAIHALREFASISFWTNINNRPLASLTFSINYWIHGNSVWGYHLANLVIHFLSGLFLFYLLRLLRRTTIGQSYFPAWLPLVATIYFLVHPAQTQAVTYIVQRMTSQAGMFFILSVYLYALGRVVYLQNNEKRKSVIYLGLATLSGIAGLMSKQSVVVFPVAFLLVEWFFIRRKDGSRCMKYILVAVASGFALVTAYILAAGLPFETKEITRLQYFSSQMMVIPRYFQLMLIPFGLSIDHGVIFPDNFFNSRVILGLLFIFGILSVAVLLIRKMPLVSFGIFWVFIALFIESSIFPITDPMFDHRMYLPLAGFGISFWSLTDFLLKQRPKWLKPLIFILLLCFSIATFARNRVWQSRTAIWEQVTERYPDHFRGWFALGRMYKTGTNEDVVRAIKVYEKALTIKPDHVELIYELGVQHLKLRQEEIAVEYFKKVLTYKRTMYHLDATRALAAYYASRKEYVQSISFFNRILKQYPKDNQANSGLIDLYVGMGDFQSAEETAQKWLTRSKDNFVAYLNMGKVLFAKGDRRGSKSYFLTTLEKQADNTEAMLLYANACINTGDYDEAIAFFQRAYSILAEGKILEYIELTKKLKAQAISGR